MDDVGKLPLTDGEVLYLASKHTSPDAGFITPDSQVRNASICVSLPTSRDSSVP